MEKVEIRVRPVVRHIVTRYREAGDVGVTSTRGSIETLGEFDNEGQAERVAEALRAALPKPMQYVCVERTIGEPLTNAAYFDFEDDAKAYVEHALSKGREYRVYAREITDPVKLAHHEMGMVGYGFPGGIEHVELPPPPPSR